MTKFSEKKAVFDQNCVFPSGIAMRQDGRADLYSGLGDVLMGRVVIDDPFEGFGQILAPL